MRRRSTHAAVVFTIFLSVTVSSARASDTDIVTVLGPTASVDWEAITAAVETLPRQPIRIAVMDVTQNRPDVRNYLLSLDAFTVAGNGVVYIVQQSETLKGARTGSALFRAMLGVVIWHEMAHLDGADERGARELASR